MRRAPGEIWPRPLSDARPTDAKDLSEWLARVTGAFQKLVLLARGAQTDPKQLEEQLARIPAPRNRFEALVIRYFVDDCLMAILGDSRVTQSPAILKQFTNILLAVHRDPNPLEELAKALGGPAKIDANALLANTISSKLEQDIGRRITARTMAVEYGIGRTQLDRLFRERFGVGFHRYLTSMRVKRGLDLVMSGMKVEAAAVCVGYRSKKDFYRAVREETGSTPGKLRRSGRLGSEKRELPLKQGTLFGLT
jgi:methylphosphotriester-DNA--protein-cysteine methyltransferase